MEIFNNKELYEAPSMKIFEVKLEGIICESQNGGAGMQNYYYNDYYEE